MIGNFPVFFIFFIGALILLLTKGKLHKFIFITIPALAFFALINTPVNTEIVGSFLGIDLKFIFIDKLSKVWGYIFAIMAFSSAIFAYHNDDYKENIYATLYIGSSYGVVFAGNLLTLFIFWELMAIFSTMIIFARKTDASTKSGFRYLLVHALGGQLLFAGMILYYFKTGNLDFGYIGLQDVATLLIMLGFAINAAIPPFSAWLSDSYPESTVTGTVFLSAYTSKTAVYVLARSFPGEEILLYAGAIMTVYGIIYAILENDMRRVLSYSIINQVGFMIAGVGLGTQMAINGAAAHAFAHILYKALLMMGAGAVLYRTGISKTSRLGGLYKTMPYTLLFSCIGAAAISAFPLTSGFTSKSLIIAASAAEHKTFVYHILLLASAGVFLHAGIKFPYFVFFQKDSGLRPKEAPKNMLIAMGFVSFLCILLGVYPQVLYNILPYEVDFKPYTASHVLLQLQILMFSAAAFFFMLPMLKRTETITLDTDWFYRKGGALFISFIDNVIIKIGSKIKDLLFTKIPDKFSYIFSNPDGYIKIIYNIVYYKVFEDNPEKLKENKLLLKDIGRVKTDTHIGISMIWVTLFMAFYLLIYYFYAG
ncbi:MAG: multicomponent Na+:H+ antiporter subunit [Deferribacteres bacterium]|jgi:multicomponent Na+:H+ antiporter subunit D|nr:multicomponent Na+:H+ antiporter subunit [Deferribacteres bacterium]